MSVYAEPQNITDINQCYFYHSMDLPGHGEVVGQWDLRGHVDEYLGHYNLKGKRVLELGTADGFLTYEMERRGAEVVSYDLSPDHKMDVVPFARRNLDQHLADDVERIAKLNRAYWFAHRLYNSNAKVVYGDIYHVPQEIGLVDVVTFGSILLHVRDPFLAMATSAPLAKEAIIVSDVFYPVHLPPQIPRLKRFLPKELQQPAQRFRPAWPGGTHTPYSLWWNLSPEIVQSYLQVLGFEDQVVTYHSQKNFGGRTTGLFARNGRRFMYTIVGRRTVPVEQAGRVENPRR